MPSFKFIRRATGVTGSILLLLAGASVAAAPIDESEELMRKGNQLRRAGDDEGALPIFKKAHEIYNSPRTTAQLGLVEWALGRWVEADEHLTEALKAVNTDVWIRTNRQTIEDSLKVAKRNVGRVEITGDPPGAEVLVNGRAVGKVPLPQPVRVIAGSVDIELRAPGYRPGFRTISVAGLQHQPVVIRLEKEGAPRGGLAGGPGPIQRPGSLTGGAYEPDLATGAGMAPWRKAMIGVAAGAAGLSLGAGAYGVWRYNDQVDAFNARRCLETANGAILASTRMTDLRCTQLKSSFETAKTMTIVGFSAAGALAVTGLVLFLTGGADSAHASAPAARLACAPDLTRPGLLCALPF